MTISSSYRKWLSFGASSLLACAPLACAGHSEDVAESNAESSPAAIIGGRNATETYSFMVALSNGCGGSLVSNQWIVTADHCGAASSGRIGSTQRNSGGEVIGIDRRITLSGTDLTMMHLSQPATSAPIRLADTPPQPGTPARLIGFGCTSWPSCSNPSTLQEIDLQVLDPSACAAGGGTADDVCISGDADHSACHGDSGGPAITGSSGNWTLVGETHGPGDDNGECATTTLYTGIAAHLDWIKQQIGGTTPPPNATPLQNNVAISGISGATGSNKLYSLAVTPGATGLKFTTVAATSGDADIYVKFGSAPTTGSYDCRSIQDVGVNESCAIPSAKAGTYYVLVYGYSTYSNTSLKGSFTP